MSLRSSSSARLSSVVCSLLCILGSTCSPGVYLRLISSLSDSGRPFSGCAATNMSSRFATVALCFVSRTVARQDGQVNIDEPGDGGLGERSAVAAWKVNHSFRHAPQKVWIQSRRVSGWKRSSVHI